MQRQERAFKARFHFFGITSFPRFLLRRIAALADFSCIPMPEAPQCLPPGKSPGGWHFLFPGAGSNKISAVILNGRKPCTKLW
jgi:hypothetical protein